MAPTLMDVGLPIFPPDIILACTTWGQGCDNQVVVWSLNQHRRNHATFVEASYNIHIDSVTHANHLADDLSRNRLPSFFVKADAFPSHVPWRLLDLLLDQQINRA